jgi:hypothetical protein
LVREKYAYWDNFTRSKFELLIMQQITYKTVKNASNILVQRDDSYKIKAIILVFDFGKYGPYALKYFEKKAQDYILKRHRLVLSSLEVELL